MVTKIIDTFLQFGYTKCLYFEQTLWFEKMTQDEFRDYMVKYLLHEGLKCYKIPLPPVLSKKIGTNHTIEHNSQRLNEQHFITNISGGEEQKRKIPTRCCFVCSILPGLNCKPERTSF